MLAKTIVRLRWYYCGLVKLIQEHIVSDNLCRCTTPPKERTRICSVAAELLANALRILEGMEFCGWSVERVRLLPSYGYRA